MYNSKLDYEQLKNYFFQTQYINCTPEEESELRQFEQRNGYLPNGIVRNMTTGGYCKIIDCGLTAEEKDEYLKLKQLQYIDQINKNVYFFKTLAIVAIALLGFSLFILAVST